LSKVQVDTIDTRSGTSTMQIGSTNTSTINIGVSGDTVNIPAGVTIANAGTATGFGIAGTVLFQATGTSSQTGNGDNVSVKRNFVTEVFDTASAYDTSNSRFTVPSGQGGKYLISANINMEAASNGVAENAELQIRVNGTSVRNTFLKSNNNNFDRFDMNQTTILNLSAGDYVEIYGHMNTSGGQTWDMYAGANTNVFTGFRIA
jgi:hypothetical protein